VTKELEFGNGHRIATARKCLLRRSTDCMEAIGGLEVAIGATGARRQDLSDALAGREGRHFRIEWAWAIALLAPEPMRAEVASCLVEALGYGIAPIRPLTDAEKLARLEYRVATRFGQAGAELVEENRR
jgi:hypothetical protein